MLQLTAWLLVGCGMITLLAAANNKPSAHECKEVVVTVQGSGEKFYVEKSDIIQQLKKAEGSLVGQPIVDVNLSKLEKALLKNAWIQEAQLYFDSKDVLHVVVKEREPIARVFTAAGGSFYIDSAGKRMPLLNKVGIRLPVVTNFTAATKWNARDSAMVKSLTKLLLYINEEEFWSSQIAQIDVQPNQTFELIPLVGNHVIRIGKTENLDQKLDNLFLFYKKVLSKTGFDIYKVLDVQYKGQVIGVKTNPTAVVDSIQLQKNIAALIEKTKAQAATDSLFSEKVNEFLLQKDTASIKLDAIIVNPSSDSIQQNTVKPKKAVPAKSNPTEKPKKIAKTEQKPKAVMQRRNG
jgi:cell division protein FtsQ